MEECVELNSKSRREKNTEFENVEAFSRWSKKTKEKMNYCSNLFSLFRNLICVVDQFHDIVLFIYLIIWNEYTFAAIFIVTDLLPGIFLVSYKSKTEPNSKFLSFWCHSYNILRWSFRTFYQGNQTETFLDIRATHTAIEAPLQILFKLTLMSRGIISYPGSKKIVFENYDASIDMSWFPIAAICCSILGIILGKMSPCEIISKRTFEVLGTLAFIPIFAFRMYIWILIIISLGSFTIIPCICFIASNFGLYFCLQKDIEFDPMNHSVLAIIFPVQKLPSTKVKDENAADRISFCLVVIGNFLLLAIFLMIFTFYKLEIYNPWCREFINDLQFPEELFANSVWIIVGLFCASTFPTIFAYFVNKIKYLASFLVVACICGSVIFIIVQMFEFRITLFELPMNSIIVQKPPIYNFSKQGWGPWTHLPHGIERYRECTNGKFFKQVKLNETRELKGFEEMYNCKDGKKSDYRILLISPQDEYLFGSIISNPNGAWLPDKKKKSSDRLLTVTGYLRSNNSRCLTIIETPQLFNSIDVIDSVEKIILRSFKEIIVAIKVFDPIKPLETVELNNLIGQLQIIGHCYSNIWPNIHFYGLRIGTNDSLSQQDNANFHSWLNKILPDASDGKRQKKTELFWTRDETKIDPKLSNFLENHDQGKMDHCRSLNEEDKHFFTKVGYTWTSTEAVIINNSSETRFSCYLYTNSFDGTKIQLFQDGSEIKDVRLDSKELPNSLVRTDITMKVTNLQGYLKCIYNDKGSVNCIRAKSLTVPIDQVWSEWSSWSKCTDIDGLSTRYRSNMNKSNETQSRLCQCQDLENYPKPRIVLIGPPKIGKTTFSNFILGGYKTIVSGEPETSKTKEVSVAVGRLMGTGQCITLVDTPGTNNAKGHNENLVKSLHRLINTKLKSIDVFLLFAKGNQDGLSESLIDMIEWLEIIFGTSIWNNIAMQITFWRNDGEHVKDEATFSSDLLKPICDKFSRSNIPMVFIDVMNKVFSDSCTDSSVRPSSKQFKYHLERLNYFMFKETPYVCNGRCQLGNELWDGTPVLINPENRSLVLDLNSTGTIQWEVIECLDCKNEYYLSIDGNYTSQIHLPRLKDTSNQNKTINGTGFEARFSGQALQKIIKFDLELHFDVKETRKKNVTINLEKVADGKASGQEVNVVVRK